MNHILGGFIAGDGISGARHEGEKFVGLGHQVQTETQPD